MRTIDWGTRRPPMYDNPEALQDKISEYFESGVTERIVIVGQGANKREIKIPVPTITGLCSFCGFESRQSFYDYEKKPEFSYTIKKARLFIEQEYEEQLQTGGGAAAIFALKNFGWKDERQLSISDDTEQLSEIIRQLAKNSGEHDFEPDDGHEDDVQDDSTQADADDPANA